MAAKQELKATARPKAGKGAARSTRRAGRVPGVIYGDKKPPVSISLDAAELTHRIHAGHFLTTLFSVDVDGQKHEVISRGYQLDPLRDHPTHVDFQRVAPGATVRVAVPVKFINQDAAPGIKRGGTLNIVRHTVEFLCPADAIPDFITADLTGLEIGHSLHISAIKLPEKVRPVIRDRDFTVATIVSSSGYLEEQLLAKQKEAEAAAAALAGAVPGIEGAPVEGAEGAAAAPGAAAPAEGAAAPAADAKGGDKGKK
ncbi:MAG TPA: 50S ribosomal protein L25/general stress protein Ctc [Xanthobacteraceae bacterium]|nr:50S ribosomal protein L25/general stress protein Ctc [Xanthobacteraceae bacterium]